MSNSPPHRFYEVFERTDVHVGVALQFGDCCLGHIHGFGNLRLRQLPRMPQFLKRHLFQKLLVARFAPRTGLRAHFCCEFGEFLAIRFLLLLQLLQMLVVNPICFRDKFVIPAIISCFVSANQ